MKYQTGKTGRVIVARFEDHEDILDNITSIASKENIRSAVLYLVGGIRQGRVVVGPEKEEFPPNRYGKRFTKAMKQSGSGQSSGRGMNRRYISTGLLERKTW